MVVRGNKWELKGGGDFLSRNKNKGLVWNPSYQKTTY